MKTSKFAKGFQTFDQEIQIEQLNIQGKVPQWLAGSLFRTGPSKFELENQSYNHWFDGLAMLHKFAFYDGNVRYACRMVKSDSYQKATDNGKVGVGEFATDPCKTLFQKVLSYFQAPALTDNANISIIKYDDVIAATTETPLPVVFDPETLETLGKVTYEDDISGQIEPAHPHYDEEGNFYNYLLKYSLISEYQIYKAKPHSGVEKRQRIQTIKTRTPSYMHSIAMSENYIVLAEFPKIVKPLEMKFGDKPLIENYHWKPELGVVYQVVNRHNGEVQVFEGDPFFAFHHINAFEEGDLLHIDLAAFDDASIIDELYLNELRSNNPTNASGLMKRITLNLKTGERPTIRQLSDKSIELPGINYKQYNARPYRYAYGTGTTKPGNFLDDITKIDAETGESKVWYEKHHYPGEPIFVAAPDARKEDEGVLLSVVLDSDKETSYLLILDAQEMTEIARASVPHAIPFNFHGMYVA